MLIFCCAPVWQESSRRKRKSQTLGESTPLAGTSAQDTETETRTDPDVASQPPSAEIEPSGQWQMLKEALRGNTPPATYVITLQASGAEHAAVPKRTVLVEMPPVGQSESSDLSAWHQSPRSSSQEDAALGDDGGASAGAVAQETLAEVKEHGEVKRMNLSFFVFLFVFFFFFFRSVHRKVSQGSTPVVGYRRIRNSGLSKVPFFSMD